MPTKSELFPSKYLKAEDLKGNPVVLTIKGSDMETLKDPKTGRDQEKLVLSFDRTKKLLPLNMTNFDAVVEVTREENSDRWIGHRIEVYPTTTRLGVKTVACIRIRKPQAAPAERGGFGNEPPPIDNFTEEEPISS
jgi:hypothetical protein